MPTYSNKDCVRFVRDMQEIGLKVEHYKGGHQYEGPSVFVSDVNDVITNTRVKCLFDQQGHKFIVYPVSPDCGTNQKIKEVSVDQDILDIVNYEDEELEKLGDKELEEF